MIMPGIDKSVNAYSVNAFRKRTSVQYKNDIVGIAPDTLEKNKDSSKVTKNDKPIFDDRKPVEIPGIRSGREISTKNKINWDADGTSQLTEDQIKYLKTKYDLSNMTEQDYYDLMSDLTNMNVLSGEEVKSQHVAPVIIGASSSSASAGIAEGEYSNFQGNLYHNVHTRLQDITDSLIALNSGNCYFPSQNMQQANESLLRQKQIYQKLSSIYELLKP